MLSEQQLTAVEIAKKTGVAASTVRRWVAGTTVPGSDHRRALEALCGVPEGSWEVASDATPEAPQAADVKPAGPTIEEAETHLRIAVRALREAESGTPLDRSRAIDAHRKALTLLCLARQTEADIEGTLAHGPRYQAVLRTISDALIPHPKALAAVDTALHALEARGGNP